MYHLVADQAEDMEISSDTINGLKVNLYICLNIFLLNRMLNLLKRGSKMSHYEICNWNTLRV